MIGQDNFDIIATQTVIKGAANAPRAVQTPLGWTIAGPNSECFGHSAFRTFQHRQQPTDEDQLLSELLANSWRVDTYAISPNIGMSKEDKHALHTLQNTTKYIDGRYEVGLLWKPDAHLPNNYSAAKHHFTRMKQHLSKQKEVQNLYEQTIAADLEKGYIRKLKNDEIPETGWLLPEHGVFNPNKPGKLRRVSNAASKFKGVCLNDMLLTGPDLLSNLLAVIIRFREHRYPISADIEGMYMQVSVRPDDRKFLRFLYGKDRPEFYEYVRHVFGAKCSPTCAIYVLQACAHDNLKDYPHLQKLVLNNFYMDDFYEAVDSKEEAHQLIKDLSSMLQRGGFNLTKWVTTDKEILANIPPLKTAITSDKLDDTNSTQRVLGVKWNLHRDELIFEPKKCQQLKTLPPTQRSLLTISSSLFDPLGIATPVKIRLRILQQTIWRHGLSWDDPIKEDDIPAFHNLLKEIEGLEEIKICRHYFNRTQQSIGNINLHVFTDASYTALATVAYFVYIVEEERTHTTFVLGKARVAPLKQQTITKLELQAALFGARLAKFITREQRLPITSTHLWTDSSTVLQWIYGSEKKQPIFIANRVAEILELTEAA